MSVRAKELLSTYSNRMEMQEDGVTNPSEHIKEFTKALVLKLSAIDGAEKIEIKIDEKESRFILKRTGELLARHDNEIKE